MELGLVVPSLKEKLQKEQAFYEQEGVKPLTVVPQYLYPHLQDPPLTAADLEDEPDSIDVTAEMLKPQRPLRGRHKASEEQKQVTDEELKQLDYPEQGGTDWTQVPTHCDVIEVPFERWISLKDPPLVRFREYMAGQPAYREEVARQHEEEMAFLETDGDVDYELGVNAVARQRMTTPPKGRVEILPSHAGG